MKSIQIGKIMILLAILTHLVGISGLFSSDVSMTSQMLTLVLLVLAYLTIDKKKAKRKRKKPAAVRTLLDRAKQESNESAQ
ncbi:hypothetical protein [Brevibacillus daliensis]|uniref:hypothetical protein n=1 Tax=Brevibacillus daliensis TaxID=2892995 RepID=UPI001E363755|nr:hypothetical protein [Brevibacillus daliensis]